LRDDPRFVPAGRRNGWTYGEHERLAVRQDLGPAMTALGFFQMCQRHRRAANRSHSKQSGIRGAEDDGVVRKPGSAASDADVRHHDGRPAGDRRLAQFAAGEERHPLAVGREERLICVFGTRHQGRFHFVDATEEKPPPAIPNADVGDAVTVPRHRQGGSVREALASVQGQRESSNGGIRRGGRTPGHRATDDRHHEKRRDPGAGAEAPGRGGLVRDRWRRNRSLMKAGGVMSLCDLDDDRIRLAPGRVVLLQSRPQAAGLHAHDRVDARIEPFAAIEDSQSD
jgi:hypothetical protein